MKYRVHIYAIVRVPVEVEAESQQEAINTAEESVDLEMLFSHPEYEYADEIESFLVDEVDDIDYLHTRSYDAAGKRTS